MSVSYIPEKTKLLLWGKSAGRCQYDGCREKLYRDDLTKAEFNAAYIAHIVADKPKGPRGDDNLSPLLKDKLSNLMLLCDSHHRLVDKVDVDGHPRDRLEDMKRRQESEMERLTSLTPDRRSHIILYGSKIGLHDAPLTYEKSALAMVANEKYPVTIQPIKLGMANSTFEDDGDEYWNIQTRQLEAAFNRDVRPLIGDHDIQHFSVFALAPQPLLIKLGTLLADINSVGLYQKNRVPDTWEWQDESDIDDFLIKEPSNKAGIPAMVLSLSATVNDERLVEVLGENTSIWKITINEPNNDFMKSKKLLSRFNHIIRKALDRIKSIHGGKTALHVFPAMPVTAAIEFGRVWMPKADMQLVIYDQNKKRNGFYKTIEIR